MKNLISIILLTTTLSSIAGELDCDSAIESTANNPALEHLPAMEVCMNGKDVVVKSENPVPVQHLVYAGIHLGIPLFGYDLTYMQLKNGKPNFHIAYDAETNLQAVSHGVRFGIHPKQTAFFYGGEVRAYSTTHQNGMMITPQAGFMGNKKFITFNATVGMGFYKEGPNYGATPELNLGIRIRLFKSKPR